MFSSAHVRHVRTASWWAVWIFVWVDASAMAHNTEMDLGTEKVRSNPLTPWRTGAAGLPFGVFAPSGAWDRFIRDLPSGAPVRGWVIFSYTATASSLVTSCPAVSPAASTPLPNHVPGGSPDSV